MNLSTVFTLAALAVASVVNAASIGHDKVQPFPQPEPVTVADKVAIKFKPQLISNDGCQPYPAVNAAGETNAGLKATGAASGDCRGSALGSQVYGRSGWYRGLWAIMYTWYFPKDRSKDVLYRLLFYNFSHRHDWASIVVWIDNPAVETPKVMGVSTGWFAPVSYFKNSPPLPQFMDGTSPMINYFGYANEGYLHSLVMCTVRGEFQDLIMWEQLTDAARTALSTTDFGKDQDTVVPFIDANFETNLERAWPY